MNDLDLMIGLLAYDTGAVDAGIRDDQSKHELFERLHSDDNESGIATIVTEYAAWLLSDEGKSKGYTLEDVKQFIEWLSDNGYEI